jgi:hypothetical protein
MNKYLFIITTIFLLNIFIGCNNDLNETVDHSMIEGNWERDGVYLSFSNQLWECLITLDSMPPFFNGDESESFPDGFASYDEYVNAGKFPSTPYYFKGTGGNFEMTNNNLTLYDNNEKYIFKYEIKNNILHFSSSKNNILKITYDDSIFLPFNLAIRSNNFDLNGTWSKKARIQLASQHRRTGQTGSFFTFLEGDCTCFPY